MAKKQKFIYDIGVFDEKDNEIEEINVEASSEEEAWAFIDKKYGRWMNGAIYDCNVA